MPRDHHAPLSAARTVLAAGLCLCLLGACTAGNEAASQTSSRPSVTSQAADPDSRVGSRGTEEVSQGDEGDATSQAAEDLVQYGPDCTALDLQNPTDPEDIVPETSREAAAQMVDLTLPAAETVVVPNNFETTSAYVIQVEAGAQKVQVDAAGVIVIVEGSPEEVVVNGSVDVVWVDNVKSIHFTPEASASNVFWTGSVPELLDEGISNAAARAEYAVAVSFYC